MKTIGLIGGMSFESSAVYYRQVNEAVRARLGGLASAEVLMHSVNFEEIVALQKAGRWDLAAKRLSDVAAGLERAGATCVLICTNTMHMVADEVEAGLNVPLINIIDETALALKAGGAKRPLLLATRYTMEQPFYAERMSAMASTSWCQTQTAGPTPMTSFSTNSAQAGCWITPATGSSPSLRRQRQTAPTASSSAALKSA